MGVIKVDFGRRTSVEATETQKLRAETRSAAAALSRHVGREVIVRSSEDGRVVTAVADTAVGYRLRVTVGSYSTLRRRPQGEDIGEWLARKVAAPREVVVDVLADIEWLSDHALATEGTFGAEHANPEFHTAKEAVAWVEAHCLARPVDRVSAAELLEWSRTMVTVRDPTDPIKRTQLSLQEAVKVYGPVYGYEVSPAALVDNHRLTIADARIVANAVRKILPRRKS